MSGSWMSSIWFLRFEVFGKMLVLDSVLAKPEEFLGEDETSVARWSSVHKQRRRAQGNYLLQTWLLKVQHAFVDWLRFDNGS